MSFSTECSCVILMCENFILINKDCDQSINVYNSPKMYKGCRIVLGEHICTVFSVQGMHTT